MANPKWITKAGDLGIIAEREFYNLRLDAYDPDGGPLTYSLVAGTLPHGLSLKLDGTLEGIPGVKKTFLRGVPLDVGENVTSKFAVRIQASTGEVADRTFILTVTGQDIPKLLDPPAIIGTTYDGSWFEYQLTAVDLDNEQLYWDVNTGQLPPGLTLNPLTGLISGYVEPVAAFDQVGDIGYDNSPFALYSFDFGTKSISKTWQFSISVTDKKDYDLKKYAITILSKNSMTADNNNATADMDPAPTADVDNRRIPILLTKAADLGEVLHDNYFAFQFIGLDFDADMLLYQITVDDITGFNASGFDSVPFDYSAGELPPGLLLDEVTGWLYGYIPVMTAIEQEFEFGVRVYKKDYPDYKSPLTYFKMKIVGDVRKVIHWETPTDLGWINNGSISELEVKATTLSGVPLFYKIKSGSDSKLPQGLKLLQNGLIVGRPSFTGFNIDSGNTTFDHATLPTTFDTVFKFTVTVYSLAGDINVSKEFTLHVRDRNNAPYENLYLVAKPIQEDRELWQSIVQNSDDIPQNMLYRPEDPNFGKSRDIRFLLANGLKASRPMDYIAAMATNHYKKTLRFGNVRVAQALHEGEVAYEVVYIDIVDPLENELKESTSRKQDLIEKTLSNVYVSGSNITVDRGVLTVDRSSGVVVFPNSLDNMRNVLIEKLTQSNSSTLPLWMSSKQPDGKQLGMTYGVVIAYVKPGCSSQVAFNISQRYDVDFKNISFEVDRYVWDNNMSRHYDVLNEKFITEHETTFDVLERGPWNVSTVDTTAYWLTTSVSTIQKLYTEEFYPATITFAGMSQISPLVVANPYFCRFKIYENDNVTPSYSSVTDEQSKVYAPSITANKIKVEMYKAGSAGTKIDEQTIYIVRDTQYAITAIVSNDSVTLPSYSDGAVTSYKKSGTSIEVYEGLNKLTYVSGVPSISQFTVEHNTQSPADITAYGIKIGDISGNGTTSALINDHSQMALSIDEKQIQYALTIKRSDNTIVLLNPTQRIVKSKAVAADIIDVVDYAVSVPFNWIHGQTTKFIQENQVFDMTAVDYNGKYIIFAEQEANGDAGWLKTDAMYDDSTGFDTLAFENTILVPGWTEKQQAISPVNQRAGIWKVVVTFDNSVSQSTFSDENVFVGFDAVLGTGFDSTPYNQTDMNASLPIYETSLSELAIVRLEFVKEIFINERVDVARGGQQYGGRSLFYDPEIKPGHTVPAYSRLPEIRNNAQKTTFDGNSTRFIGQLDLYEEPDYNDQHLAFPRYEVYV